MRYISNALVALALVVFACSPVMATKKPAAPLKPIDPHFSALVQRLADDGFSLTKIERLFQKPGVVYDSGAMGKKIQFMYKRKFLPKAPHTPNPSSAHRVKPQDPHLTPDVVARLRVIKSKYGPALLNVERRYGVPSELALALLVVESKVGGDLGDKNAFSNLASMAASTRPEDVSKHLHKYRPTTEQWPWVQQHLDAKSQWAYQELQDLILYGVKNKLDVTTFKGSIYGAIGLCQFLPSVALKYGEDGDGDGKADLFNPADAIMSVGKFVKQCGWKNNLDRTGKITVLKRYDPDYYFAITVLEVATRI